MLLIQVNTWLGPNSRLTRKEREASSVLMNEHEAYATRLPLNDALKMLYEIQEKHNSREGATTGLTYRLLGVQETEDCDDEVLNDLGVVVIEKYLTRDYW